MLLSLKNYQLKLYTFYNSIKKKYILFFSFLFVSFLSFSQAIETPEIDYITVNEITGKPIISWTVNNPTLLNGYILKRYIYSCPNYNPNWHTIKIIEDENQTLFEDNTTTCEAQANVRLEKYSIRAFRISGNDTIKSSISTYHQTIFLELEYNYCEKSNHLKWNNYIGWGSKFQKYDIFCKEGNASFVKIGSTTFNDTVFIHSNVNYNSNYKYFIKAIRDDAIESKSNISSIYTQAINFPQYLNADSLIVNNKINLYFNIDTNSDAERYNLYKSETFNGTYDSINGINNTEINSLHFKDIYEHKRNYYYISAIDYCNDEIFRSEIISNIELSLKKKNDIEKVNILKWDNDENIEYKIIRCKNENNNCLEVNTTYNLTYNDDLNEVFENQFSQKTSSGKFCYYVLNETYNFVNKSNTECVIYDETFYIANAFNPNSTIAENRTFKPKIAFINDYELIVFGTYGDVIFSTKNPSIGWDGKLPNGKLAERSSYLYFILYTNSSGVKVKKKGQVSLVY